MGSKHADLILNTTHSTKKKKHKTKRANIPKPLKWKKNKQSSYLIIKQGQIYIIKLHKYTR